MSETDIVLMPGFDGTGRLFKRFIAAAPPQLSVTSVALFLEPRTYNDLADDIVRNLPEANRPSQGSRMALSAELAWLPKPRPVTTL